MVPRAASGRSLSSSADSDAEQIPRASSCFPSMTSNGGLSIELKDSGACKDRISKCMTCALTIDRPGFHSRGQEFAIYNWGFNVHLVPVNHRRFDVDSSFGQRALLLLSPIHQSIKTDRPKDFNRGRPFVLSHVSGLDSRTQDSSSFPSTLCRNPSVCKISSLMR